MGDEEDQGDTGAWCICMDTDAQQCNVKLILRHLPPGYTLDAAQEDSLPPCDCHCHGNGSGHLRRSIRITEEAGASVEEQP